MYRCSGLREVWEAIFILGRVWLVETIHSQRELVKARMGKQRGTKFITIVELERRQSKAKQQAKEKKVAKQASQKKARAEQMANASVTLRRHIRTLLKGHVSETPFRP